MNPHILFIIDHLANPDKYNKEQLKQNSDDACAYASDSGDPYAYAAYATANAASDYNDDDATYWLGRYFKMTGENRQEYLEIMSMELD